MFTLNHIKHIVVYWLSLSFLFLALPFKDNVCQADQNNVKKEIVAAVLTDFPPLYIQTEKGDIEGFAIDILSHVAGQKGIEIKYMPVENWAKAMEAVRKGKADLIPGIGISPSRSSEFLFTEKIETIAVSCFVRFENHTIKGIPDLDGQRVGVIGQSAAMTKLKNNSAIHLVPFSNIESAVMLLLTGDIDAFVFPEPVLMKKLRQIGLENKFKVVGKPLMELKRGFLLNKSSMALKEALDPLIKHFTSSQAYLVSYTKWYGKPKPFWTVKRIFIAMSVLVLGVVVAFSFFHWVSMVRVNKELKKNVDDLSRAQKEINNLNRDLERRVKNRTRQLESANKELDAFAYSVSHDLRAPLRGIDGFSLALVEDCEDALNDMGKDYLGRIRKGCLKMGVLIDDMLKLSRLSRGEIKKENLDISTMARKIFYELKESHPDQEVQTHVEDNIWGNGDPALIRVVLENLLGNAWKFSSQTEDAEIWVETMEKEERQYVVVKDNGAGFDMAYANKLFNAFQRLHSPSEFEGTGIGLATVQRVISRHGGSIEAQGEVGKGAQFYFTLS